MAIVPSLVKKKKPKKASSSSGGFSMPSTSSNTNLSSTKNVQASGSTFTTMSNTKLSEQVTDPNLRRTLTAEPTGRRGGGGFRGTFFQANRPTGTRNRGRGRSRTRAPRTASGRTFDDAARARIAAARAARASGGSATGDTFEILIKTYSEIKRDALAEHFLDVLIEEMPVGETGVLVDSAHVEETSETEHTASATVVVDAPYAQYVNDGTGPVENTLMVFEADGETVFTMSRRAIDANPFWERALARWDEVVSRAGGEE